jgi:hypothetical protein
MTQIIIQGNLVYIQRDVRHAIKHDRLVNSRGIRCQVQRASKQEFRVRTHKRRFYPVSSHRQEDSHTVRRPGPVDDRARHRVIQRCPLSPNRDSPSTSPATSAEVTTVPPKVSVYVALASYLTMKGGHIAPGKSSLVVCQCTKLRALTLIGCLEIVAVGCSTMPCLRHTSPRENPQGP